MQSYFRFLLISVNPGKYLLCVVGENYIGRTNFNLLAVPTVHSADAVSGYDCFILFLILIAHVLEIRLLNSYMILHDIKLIFFLLTFHMFCSGVYVDRGRSSAVAIVAAGTLPRWRARKLKIRSVLSAAGT